MAARELRRRIRQLLQDEKDVGAVTADQGGNLHRVQTACYLILTSNYYNVWH